MNDKTGNPHFSQKKAPGIGIIRQIFDRAVIERARKCDKEGWTVDPGKRTIEVTAACGRTGREQGSAECDAWDWLLADWHQGSRVDAQYDTSPLIVHRQIVKGVLSSKHNFQED